MNAPDPKKQAQIVEIRELMKVTYEAFSRDELFEELMGVLEGSILIDNTPWLSASEDELQEIIDDARQNLQETERNTQ